MPLGYTFEVGGKEPHRNRLSTLLILFYLALLVIQPQNRFPYLGEIQFEKIVVGAIVATLIFGKGIALKAGRMTFLVLAFYAILLVSYLVSPYNQFQLSQEWLGNYWKYILLYFLIILSTKELRSLRLLFIGFAGIIAFYQAYSWWDFLHGGSYVWQQGIRRMVGMWTEGIGAANYFGMLTVYSLPFLLFWYQASEEKVTKAFVLGCFFMTTMSVVYSGTRGALLTFLFFVAFNLIRMKKYLAICVSLAVLFLSVQILPSYLVQRYSTVIPSLAIENRESDSTVDEMQRGSALSRLNGITDALSLVAIRPLIGHGPNSSPLARMQVNEMFADSEEVFQMHSLYGQVLAESGILGTAIFFLIVLTCLAGLGRVPRRSSDDRCVALYQEALVNFLLILLCYGFASHTLYRYYWPLAWGLCAAFLHIMKQQKLTKSAEH